MNPVVIHSSEMTFTAAHLFTLKHPLARRMTLLQRSALEPLALLASANEPFFNTVFRIWQSPLFFSSSHGDISAIKIILADLHRHSLPVSPQAFQHSVHNCVPGYFSLIFKLTAPTLTISSGAASFDIAVAHATRRLSYQCDSGSARAIAILGADERLDAQEHCDVRLLVLATPDAAREAGMVGTRS